MTKLSRNEINILREEVFDISKEMNENVCYMGKLDYFKKFRDKLQRAKDLKFTNVTNAGKEYWSYIEEETEFNNEIDLEKVQLQRFSDIQLVSRLPGKEYFIGKKNKYFFFSYMKGYLNDEEIEYIFIYHGNGEECINSMENYILNKISPQ